LFGHVFRVGLLWWTEYFDASDGEIGTVLTMNGKSGFNSMGTVVPPTPENAFTRVVKFFSDEPMDATVLSDIFANPQVLHEVKWKASPKFSPPELLDPFVVSLPFRNDSVHRWRPPQLLTVSVFQLAEGLYYPSAIENAVSAMEVMAVSGRNAALLIHDQLSNAGKGSSTARFVAASKRHPPHSDL
jgi:prenylcysteine oxidase / farnesylcysteine lyase